MGLINYHEIDFKKSINTTNKIINFNGTEIQILNYLNVNDKYDLIMITLQKSLENGIYNDFKVNQYFNLHLIYMYTNILFTEAEKANELDILDTFEKSGLLSIIKENIDELDYLWAQLNLVKSSLTTYRNSISGFLFETIDELKEKTKEGIDVLNRMSPEIAEKLISFSNSTNVKQEVSE